MRKPDPYRFKEHYGLTEMDVRDIILIVGFLSLLLASLFFGGINA
jgi:hypothetical protein